jgi:hypothetical protein
MVQAISRGIADRGGMIRIHCGVSAAIGLIR